MELDTSQPFTDHTDDEYVADAASDDHDAEHDGHQVPSDQADDLLLLLRQARVGRGDYVWVGLIAKWKKIDNN